MEEKNIASDIASASDNESKLLEKSVESMNCKEEESPTEKKNDVNNGVEEIVEGKICDDQIEEESKDKEDNRKSQLVEEIPESDAVPQEVVEQDRVNEDTVEPFIEPKEGEKKEDVAQKGDNKETLEQDIESKEVVPQEVDRQDDESKYTLEEVKDSKELAASENLVRAAVEDETQKKEVQGGITKDTEAVAEDGQTHRDVKEEDLIGNNEVAKVVDAVDKEKNEVEREHKGDTSETEIIGVEGNSEEKSVAVMNGIETEPTDGKLNGSSNEEDKEIEDKASKKRKRGRNAVDKTKGEKKDEQGEKTPVSSVSSRPVRERKSVERLVASIEKDVIREIFVEKGSGVALKDIPNVAYKLSKKKNDETFKQLHTILFGRRGKAIQMKNHVSQFSGFVWRDNEEKNKMKVREKFDKLVKEKLIEFCDVLDIPITNKVTTKKEEVVTKIMEFLASPHPRTDVLLSEKEQSENTIKRKRSAGQGSPTLGSTKGSRKRRRKTSEKPEKKGESGSDGESDKEKEDEAVTENQENGNSKHTQSKDESSEKKLSASEDAMDEDNIRSGQRPKSTSGKVISSAKKGTTPKSLKKPVLNDSEKEEDANDSRQGLKKSSEKKGSARTNTKKADTPKKAGTSSKSVAESDGKAPSSKATADKNKQVKDVKEEINDSSELGIKKKNVKTEPKGKPKEEKLKPSDKVLRNQICQILKEVDFNTATFTDILKLLGEHFKTDLTPRKASIKLMIQEELTKMADDEDEEADVTQEPAKMNA
ncbi:hypothetical protein QQ045_027080 [Rhodiola kirilowii]